MVVVNGGGSTIMPELRLLGGGAAATNGAEREDNATNNITNNSHELATLLLNFSRSQNGRIEQQEEGGRGEEGNGRGEEGSGGRGEEEANSFPIDLTNYRANNGSRFGVCVVHFYLSNRSIFLLKRNN